jgi:hypothetical protein
MSVERLMPVTACCAASRIYEQRAWSSKTSSTVGSATAPRMSCSARWPTTCYRWWCAAVGTLRSRGRCRSMRQSSRAYLPSTCAGRARRSTPVRRSTSCSVRPTRHWRAGPVTRRRGPTSFYATVRHDPDALVADGRRQDHRTLGQPGRPRYRDADGLDLAVTVVPGADAAGDPPDASGGGTASDFSAMRLGSPPERRQGVVTCVPVQRCVDILRTCHSRQLLPRSCPQWHVRALQH